MKRTTPLRARSKARAAEADERRAVVAEVLERDGYKCRAAGLNLGPCWGQMDAHEPIARGRGGDHLDPDAAVALCRSHHSTITDDPLLAERLGLGRTAGGHDGWLQAKRDVLAAGRAS